MWCFLFRFRCKKNCLKCSFKRKCSFGGLLTPPEVEQLAPWKSGWLEEARGLPMLNFQGGNSSTFWRPTTTTTGRILPGEDSWRQVLKRCSVLRRILMSWALAYEHRSLPETKILHLKYNPLKKGDSCWQPSFLGARLVLRNHNFFGSSSAFNCVNCGPSWFKRSNLLFFRVGTFSLEGSVIFHIGFQAFHTE